MQLLHLTETEKQLSEDLQWALRAPEVRQYAGKLVAVHQKRVIAVGANRDALVVEAAEKAKCPRQNVVILVVPSADFSETPR